MTAIPAHKSDQSPHAAAIEQWDNEGGAPSQTSQKRKAKEPKFLLSNRDEEADSSFRSPGLQSSASTWAACSCVLNMVRSHSPSSAGEEDIWVEIPSGPQADGKAFIAHRTMPPQD
jgi:hypothetical protein